MKLFTVARRNNPPQNWSWSDNKEAFQKAAIDLLDYFGDNTCSIKEKEIYVNAGKSKSTFAQNYNTLDDLLIKEPIADLKAVTETLISKHYNTEILKSDQLPLRTHTNGGVRMSDEAYAKRSCEFFSELFRDYLYRLCKDQLLSLQLAARRLTPEQWAEILKPMKKRVFHFGFFRFDGEEKEDMYLEFCGIFRQIIRKWWTNDNFSIDFKVRQKLSNELAFKLLNCKAVPSNNKQ